MECRGYLPVCWKDIRSNAKTHPEADYSNLQEDLRNYLRSETARKILSDNLKEILKANGEKSKSVQNRYRNCSLKSHVRLSGVPH